MRGPLRRRAASADALVLPQPPGRNYAGAAGGGRLLVDSRARPGLVCQAVPTPANHADDQSFSGSSFVLETCAALTAALKICVIWNRYRRAERLLELQRSGLVASPSSKAKALPSISSPSEAGQRLLDEQLVELQQQLQLESDLAPLDQELHRESADDHDNRGAGEIPHLVELEPEPELDPRYPEHGRTAYVRNKKHHLGKSLWVGGIPDAELAGKPDGCETALRNVFSRFGTVEKVTIREKYDDPTSHSPVGKQSWAMVGFDDESHDAVDRALEDEVMLGDATLEVKELVVKERLSDRHLNDEGKLPEKWVEFNSDPSQAAEYSQKLCCLRKATKTGRWSCGAVKKKKSLGGASKAELRAAFEMFDHDGNNAIDEEELASTMRALAKAGRMSAPSDAQLTQMMSEADVDGTCGIAVI